MSLCFEKITDPVFKIKRIEVKINSTSLSNSILIRTLDNSSEYCFSAGQCFELDCSPCKMFRAEIETFLNHGLSLKNKYYFTYEREEFKGMCVHE